MDQRFADGSGEWRGFAASGPVAGWGEGILSYSSATPMKSESTIRPTFLGAGAARASSFCSFAAAFTLMELLVGGAIIGFLSALLLPALARSKGSAQRVQCGSNLRQLGIAAQLYWNDNDGLCFTTRTTPTN